VLSAEQFDARRAEFSHERPAGTKPGSASAFYSASVGATAALGNPESLAELNDRLAKLARYDRRAFSRRKGALRAMTS